MSLENSGGGGTPSTTLKELSRASQTRGDVRIKFLPRSVKEQA